MNSKISQFFLFTVISFGALCVYAENAKNDTIKIKEDKKLSSFSTASTSQKGDEKTEISTESLNITIPEKSLNVLPDEMLLKHNDSQIPLNNSFKTFVSTSSPVLTTISPLKPLSTPATPATKKESDQTQHSESRNIGEVLSALTSPDMGKWIIRNPTTNTVCIIAQMAMQLNVTYPGYDNDLLNATMNVPKDANATGTCKETSQSVNITWGPGHSLQINFGVNKTAKDFFVSGLELNVNASVLRNNSNNDIIQFKSQEQEFNTPLDMSYKCDKIQKVNLTSSEPSMGAVLTFKNTQLEAYMNKTKEEFGAADDCEIFDTPDIVPIAVGCALAILVLIVLVAYLIGRKRSQNTGYLSM